MMRVNRFCLGFCLVSSVALSAPEPGVSDRSIFVGQSIALEQGRNAYGVAAARGAKLYFDKTNAEGGVHGRKIAPKVVDDENKAANAAANARQLIGEGVFILFGSIVGGPSTAVAEVANELKVPFFGPMAGSPNLRRPHQPAVRFPSSGGAS
jgi:ABC-type branched-subunit amino acid transport system substrate-binding protein